MAEFRQRKPGELLGMIKRQKWLILLPMLTCTAAVGYVVYKLPSVYESTSLLTVKPPIISSNLVAPISHDDLSQRISAISQEVLSRSSLEPMILKYDLYKQERSAQMPMELIVEKMYDKVKVEMAETGNERIAGFRISYRDRDPQSARNVTAELATKFVNLQVKNSVEVAESTNELFERQLAEKKGILDDLERQRLEIMTQNVATLPESEQGLVAQLEGLRQRDDTITKEKQSLYNEKGRLSDGIAANNRAMSVIEDFGEREVQDSARTASQIEDTPAFAQLVQRRADLKGQLDNLLKVYKPKHPAVIAKTNEIERLNDEIENLRKSTDRRVAVATQTSSRKAELQKKNLELENQRLQAQIGQIESQLAVKDSERAQNGQAIAALEARINAIPSVKVALESVTAQLQSAKMAYDEMLKKKNDAGVSLDVEQGQQGETIRVQDPANVPQSPVAPKRMILTLMGSGVGLFLGLIFGAFIEVPRLFRIQSIDDVKHYTGLPVLASVPPLLSVGEKTWIKRSGYLKLAAGTVAAIAIIPLVIMVLQFTRVFDRFI